VSPASGHGSDPGARFSLDFLFGRGFVAVDRFAIAPWLTASDIRVELPGLRFPFDIAGGVHRFRHLRGPVHRARVQIDPSGVADALRGALVGDDVFEDLQVERTATGLAWSVAVAGLGSSGTLCGIATPTVDAATRLRVVLHDLVAIGRHAAPAPWLAAELARRILAAQVFIPRTFAPCVDDGDVLVDVCRVVLGPRFLERGYRMPAGEHAAMRLDRSDDGWQLTIRAETEAGGASTDDADLLRLLGARDAHREARTAVLAGDVPTAIDAWDEDAAQGGLAPEAAALRLDALLARDDAASLARVTDLVDADGSLVPPLARHAARARLAEARGDAHGARAALDALADAADDHGARLVATAARVALAEHLASSAPAAAREAIDAALTTLPGSLRALRLRARIDRERRDRAGLTDALRRLAPREQAPEARLAAWRELAALARDPREALRALERARALAPDDPRVLDDLVQACVAAGRPLDAARASSRAAAAWRNRDDARAADAHHIAARLWADVLGDPASGVVEVRRALALAPGHPDRLVDLVTWALAADEVNTAADALGEARVAAERADATEPTDVTRARRSRVLAAAARLATRRGDADAAIEAAREALALAPTDADRMDALIDACVAAGRAPDALPALRQIITTADEIAVRNRARRRLADLVLALDPRSLDAEQALDEALDEDPDDRDALDRLVRLLREREELPRAATILDRIAESATSAAARGFALRLSVDVHDALGRPDRARAVLRAALAEAPGDVELLRMASRRFVEDERARAIEALAEQIDDAEAARMLGDLADEAEAAGRRDEATRLYRLALRRDDRDEWRDALDAMGAVAAVHDDGIGLDRAQPFQKTRREVQRVGARANREPAGAGGGAPSAARIDDDPNLGQLGPDEAAREHARLRSEGLRALYDDDDAAAAARALRRARALAGNTVDTELDDALETALEATDDAAGVAALYRRRLDATAEPERRRELSLLLAATLTDRVEAPDQAIEVLAPLLDAAPDDGEALRARAEALAALDDADAALDDLHAVLALDGLDPWDRQDTLRRVADVATGAGRDADAARAWEALLDDIPGDNEALRGLKRVCVRSDDEAGLLRVLGRELALLTGRLAPLDVVPEDAVARVEHVAAPLRTAFAEVAIEAASLAARTERASSALEAIASLVTAFADDPEPLDVLASGLRVLAAEHEGASPVLADALDALAEHLLDAASADALRSEAAALRTDGPAPATTADRPLRPTPALPDDVRARLAALDAEAALDPAAALEQLDAWFRSVRLPAARRELLVRRGRWLFATDAGPRAATLALKGALILDPDAPDTRLALFEAMAASDPRGAADQLGACVDAIARDGWPDDDDFVTRLSDAVRSLAALGVDPAAWRAAREDGAHIVLAAV